jgi:transposase-like protein
MKGLSGRSLRLLLFCMDAITCRLVFSANNFHSVWTAVPTGKVKEVAAVLKAIHGQEDAKAAKGKALQIVDKLRAMRLAKAAEIVDNGIDETPSFYAMPREHWRCRRTNNPLERLMGEIRRRTSVVGALPYGQSALMLVAVRLRHVAATKWGTKRYLQMDRPAEVKKLWPSPDRFAARPHGGEEQNNLNPTAFQHANEDRKCERYWTLPHFLLAYMDGRF